MLLVLPNTRVLLNLPEQALIVILYRVLFSRLIRAEEAVVISSGPIGGGGENVTRYSSILGRSGLCITVTLKIPIFCWIDITVSCTDVKLESKTVYKVTDKQCHRILDYIT